MPNPRKIGTWLQTESLFEIELPDKGVHRRPAVLALDLAEEQAYGIAIIPTPELQLLRDDLSHGPASSPSTPNHQEKGGLRPPLSHHLLRARTHPAFW